MNIGKSPQVGKKENIQGPEERLSDMTLGRRLKLSKVGAGGVAGEVALCGNLRFNRKGKRWAIERFIICLSTKGHPFGE